MDLAGIAPDQHWGVMAGLAERAEMTGAGRMGFQIIQYSAGIGVVALVGLGVLFLMLDGTNNLTYCGDVCF